LSRGYLLPIDCTQGPAPGLIATGIQRALVFSGREGDVLRFNYREFTEEGFARPTFTQELPLTMEPEGPTTIRFLGAEIQVLSAANDGLSFIVHQNF
jgi:hypothetical protein